MKSRFIHLASIVALVAIGSALASDPPSHPTPVPTPHRTFLIVHTEPLTSAAHAWAGYRRGNQGGGWRVVLHAVALDGHPTARQSEIQRVIRNTWRDANAPAGSEFAVMLLGDTESSTMSAIPAWYFPQHDSVMRTPGGGDGRNDQFASDLPYQLMDDADASPDIMLGRVPARHVDEAMAALQKIMRYEQAPTIEELMTGSRARIAYTAGEGHFGPMDGMLEELFKMMVDRVVPDAFEINMIYAKPSSIYCPPPSKVTEAVLDQLDSGALLFNYIGHGFETGFDSLYWKRRYRILTTMDLFERAEKKSAGGAVRVENQASSVKSAKSADRLRPIAFLSCCSTGCFDLSNGQRSMAEELFLNSGGAVAVIAGSRITHPYANTVMQMNITKSLLVDRSPLVGLLDLRADQAMLKRTALDRQLDSIAAPIARAGKWETSLRDLRDMHVKLYNLIGDPTMRIALPASRISNLKFENGVISGEVLNMKSGRVIVTFESSRTSMAHPEKVQAPIGENDPDLETKAANNFALANQRVLLRLDGEIVEGRFSLAMNEDVPPTAAVLRAIAVGTDELRRASDAVGAIRLPLMQDSLAKP